MFHMMACIVRLDDRHLLIDPCIIFDHTGPNDKAALCSGHVSGSGCQLPSMDAARLDMSC